MSSTALTRATEKLERLKAGLAKHKEAAKGAMRRGGLAGAAGAGVVVAAGLDAVMTENSTTAEAMLPGTDNVPLNTAIGALALGAGLAGMADEYSDHLCMFGIGVLAPKIYKATRDAVEKRG